jgi:hypothetical protein
MRPRVVTLPSGACLRRPRRCDPSGRRSCNRARGRDHRPHRQIQQTAPTPARKIQKQRTIPPEPAWSALAQPPRSTTRAAHGRPPRVPHQRTRPPTCHRLPPRAQSNRPRLWPHDRSRRPCGNHGDVWPNAAATPYRNQEARALQSPWPARHLNPRRQGGYHGGMVLRPAHHGELSMSFLASRLGP